MKFQKYFTIRITFTFFLNYFSSTNKYRKRENYNIEYCDELYLLQLSSSERSSQSKSPSQCQPALIHKPLLHLNSPFWQPPVRTTERERFEENWSKCFYFSFYSWFAAVVLMIPSLIQIFLFLKHFYLPHHLLFFIFLKHLPLLHRIPIFHDLKDLLLHRSSILSNTILSSTTSGSFTSPNIFLSSTDLLISPTPYCPPPPPDLSLPQTSSSPPQISNTILSSTTSGSFTSPNIFLSSTDLLISPTPYCPPPPPDLSLLQTSSSPPPYKGESPTSSGHSPSSPHRGLFYHPTSLSLPLLIINIITL